jgi:hypothetical protein
MNLIDLNANELVQLERLTYISGLQRIEPGPRRELALMSDPVRVGLGGKSWYDLAEWLGQRSIACAIEGPFWTEGAMRPGSGRGAIAGASITVLRFKRSSG